MKTKTTLNPEKFELETSTVWRFPDSGIWATHDDKYPVNCPPYVARNIILRYSQKGDVVLDPFVGGGTTAVEAVLTHRNFIGFDINPEALAITEEKCAFDYETDVSSTLMFGDSRALFVGSDSIDLICTQPPYADTVRYSEDMDGDLSLLPAEQFLEEMGAVALECYRVLKKDKYCAILMGDIRKDGTVQPLAFETMRVFALAGFKTEEIIIVERHRGKQTDGTEKNRLLPAHEYLFVFKK